MTPLTKRSRMKSPTTSTVTAPKRAMSAGCHRMPKDASAIGIRRRRARCPGSVGKRRIGGLSFMASAIYRNSCRRNGDWRTARMSAALSTASGLHYKGRNFRESISHDHRNRWRRHDRLQHRRRAQCRRPSPTSSSSTTSPTATRSEPRRSPDSGLSRQGRVPAAAGGRRAGRIEAVFHQGACSTTTEWNGKFMMEVN